MFFRKKKTLPFFEQVVQSLQNHFEHSSVGCWPLVSGGGNSLDTLFLYFTVNGCGEKLVSLVLK